MGKRHKRKGRGMMSEKLNATLQFLVKGQDGHDGERVQVGWMAYQRDRKVAAKKVLSPAQADKEDVWYSPAQFTEWEYDFMIFSSVDEIEQSIKVEKKEDPTLDDSDFLIKAIYKDEGGNVIIPQYICKSEVVKGEPRT